MLKQPVQTVPIKMGSSVVDETSCSTDTLEAEAQGYLWAEQFSFRFFISALNYLFSEIL